VAGTPDAAPGADPDDPGPLAGPLVVVEPPGVPPAPTAALAGLAVVVTLHQVDYAMRYCQRVVALKDGKIVYDGPSVGLDKAILVDIYGPEIQEVFWEGEQR
jgi:hypothetical protein